jgi:SPP1 family predicted phage head-tail adaptor
MKVCARDLNRPVRIERPVETDNGAGGKVVAWVKVCDAWAKMRPGRGRETMIGGVLTAYTAEIITTRWFPGVTEKWRIVFEGRVFNIRDKADLEEMHQFYEFACEEGVAS